MESGDNQNAKRSGDVAGFLDGESSLRWLEREELAGVPGETMLHLQCHFGMDTLSWAREGWDVTGVDFSETAIETARELAAEVDLDDRHRGDGDHHQWVRRTPRTSRG